MYGVWPNGHINQNTMPARDCPSFKWIPLGPPPHLRVAINVNKCLDEINIPVSPHIYPLYYDAGFCLIH